MGRLMSFKMFQNLFRRPYEVALVLGYKDWEESEHIGAGPRRARPGIRLATGIDVEGAPNLRVEKHSRYVELNGECTNGDQVLSESILGAIYLPRPYAGFQDWWETIGHHLEAVIAAADPSDDHNELLWKAFQLSSRENFERYREIIRSDRNLAAVCLVRTRPRKPRRGRPTVDDALPARPDLGGVGYSTSRHSRTVS
jgi:hypothetical protein